MGIYRKKPVKVEAFQWTGDKDQEPEPVWMNEALRDGTAVIYRRGITPVSSLMVIRTFEGNMQATPGDYIIRGVKGELYPCKPDIFELTYEKVEDLSSMLSEFGEDDCEGCKI